MWNFYCGFTLPWSDTDISFICGPRFHNTCCNRNMIIYIFGFGLLFGFHRNGPCPVAVKQMNEDLKKFTERMKVEDEQI